MKKFIENEIKISNRKENNRFRVFNLKTKQFYPDTEKIFISSSGNNLITETGVKLSLKENVIQRCTGAKDIKGDLIFHGDILRTNEMGWEAAVVWGDGQFSLEDDRGGFSSSPYWECCEIIGTIFTMKLHSEIDLADEDEDGMDFWDACWKGKCEEIEDMLPSCKKFINRNIEFTECGVKKICCLPLIALLNHLRGIYPNEKDIRVLHLLLENGADPYKKCKDMNETPFDFARRRKNDQIPVLDILKEHKTLP